MALAAVKVTVGQSLGDGRYSSVVKGGAVPGLTTVSANIATLVADGASPTQAHVTTLNTNFTAFSTALGGDVVLIWDGSVVTHRNQIRSVLLTMLKAVDGGYGGLAE